MEWFNALPPQTQVWLLNAAANATGGLAATLATSLTRALSRRVQRRFEAEPRQVALARALADALAASLSTFDLEDDLDGHYRTLFEAWLARDAVVEELALLLEPGDDAPDRDLLCAEFAAAGGDADWLIDVDFDLLLALLVGGFAEAASHEEELVEPIKIELLRNLADNMGALERLAEYQISLSRQSEGHLHRIRLLSDKMADGQDVTNDLLTAILDVLSDALERPPSERQIVYERAEAAAGQLRDGDVIRIGDIDGTGVAVGAGASASVEVNADLRRVETLLAEIHNSLTARVEPLPADELAKMERTYRQRIVEQFETLTFKGISPSGKPIALPLADVYVELKTIAEVPEAADTFSAEERRLLLEADVRGDEAHDEMMLHLDSLRVQRWKEEGRTPETTQQRRSIQQVLEDPKQRGLVILGDPGSGKSTLLHYLALREASRPEDEAGRRLPIIVPLAAYDGFLRREGENESSLQHFLAAYYAEWHSLPGLETLFSQALQRGRALVLLDGLDEVLDVTTRQHVAEQAGALIGRWTPTGNRFALTSRIVGYREARLPGNLPHVTVLDFGRAEIEHFAAGWTRAYESWVADGANATALQRAKMEEDALLDDIRSVPSVERLAASPLLLTMLALLRRQVGALPDRRILLYEKYVGTLLDNWEAARNQGARLHSPERYDTTKGQYLLMELSLWLQRYHASSTARSADVKRALVRICLRYEDADAERPTPKQHNEAIDEADRFLHDMRHFAGLLAERGRDAFGFLHLTFQEYFTGRALARLSTEERWTVMQPNLHNARWREPILLCAGWLGVVEQRRQEVTALARSILHADSEHEPILHRDRFLAAAIAVDDVGLAAPLREEIAAALATLTPSRIPTVRDTALTALVQLTGHGSGAAETALLAALDDSALTLHVMRATGKRLRARSCAALRAAISAKLDDSDYRVRRAAVQALASLVETDPDARAAISAKLDDSGFQSEIVRSAAVQALASLVETDPDARAAITAKLDDSSATVRSAAVQALAPLVEQDAEARAAITAKLNDSDNDVRRAAVQALAPLVEQDAEARAAITAKLNDSGFQSEFVRRAAVQALAPLVEQDAEVRQMLLSWLAWQVDRRYAGSGEEDLELRRRLAAVYGPRLSEDRRLLDQVVTLLRSPSWPARQGAAWALIAMPGGPPPELLPELRGLIDDERSEESWPERLQVAAIFVNHHDDELDRQAVDVALEALNYATQPWYWMPAAGREVRKPAALILGQLEPMYGDERVFRRLARVLDKDADEAVRDAAYGALLRLAAAPEETTE